MAALDDYKQATGDRSAAYAHFNQLQRTYLAAGRADLARWIAQDYVDSYAAGLNQLVRELRRVTIASRETRLKRGLPGS